MATHFFPLQPGAIVASKYRVERFLGEGGAGVVLAAKHLELGQLVAIKLVAKHCAIDAIARSKREAMAAARIRSEHVVQVHDVGVLDDGTPFIVMEYLEGFDLAERIGDVGPLPVAEAVEYAIQCCEALAIVHDAAIVHRDLKPANIFITRRADGGPLVKLLDFGLSKVLPHSNLAVSTITGPSEIAGSPGYMPPEQVRGDRDIDERADIWAVGVILYEALTGVRAFEGRSVSEVLARILKTTPQSIRAKRDDVPPALDAIVARCLAKSREDRYARAGEVADALRHVLPVRDIRAPARGETIAMRRPALGLRLAPSPPPTPSRQVVGLRPAIRPWAIAIASVCAIVIVIFAIRALLRPERPAIEPRAEASQTVVSPPPLRLEPLKEPLPTVVTTAASAPPPARVAITSVDAGVRRQPAHTVVAHAPNPTPPPTDDVPDYGGRQ